MAKAMIAKLSRGLRPTTIQHHPHTTSPPPTPSTHRVDRGGGMCACSAAPRGRPSGRRHDRQGLGHHDPGFSQGSQHGRDHNCARHDNDPHHAGPGGHDAGLSGDEYFRSCGRGPTWERGAPHNHARRRRHADGEHPDLGATSYDNLRLDDRDRRAQAETKRQRPVRRSAGAGDPRRAARAWLHRVGAGPLACAGTALDDLADALAARGSYRASETWAEFSDWARMGH